ncbi:MAG: T9SS type A sorting domain-containing protein [Bacteroidales bacterium]|nr:T9SS type A sorting domain-containing protein [Bacteroidales bacterium]
MLAKTKLFFAVLVAATLLVISSADKAMCQNLQTAQLGNETNSTYSYPINTFYNYSVCEMIFTADELSSEGIYAGSTISSISFNYFYSTTLTKENQEIYIANTTKSNFTSESDFVLAGAMTQVYSGTITYTNENGNWVSIEFNSPFIYMGGNIIVAVVNNDGSYLNSYHTFYYSNVSDNLTITTENDSYPYNLSTGTNSINNNMYGYYNTVRPNVRFEYENTNCDMINLTVSDITKTSAQLYWDNIDGVAEWQIIINNDESNIITTTGNSYQLTNLRTDTRYSVKVRYFCENANAYIGKTLSFRTLFDCAETPYECDFENQEENDLWTLGNGTATNKWHIGNATANGGENSLYISNTNGLTNEYDQTVSSTAYAYRYLNTSSDKCTISFVYKVNGENHCDFLTVVLVPAEIDIEENFSSIINESQDDCIYLTGQMTGSPSWSTFSTSAETTEDYYKLVFIWKNDGSVGSNPPAAVDNISVTPLDCNDISEPFKETFSNQNNTICWTTIGDGYNFYWSEYDKYMICTSDQYTASEEWLVSPGLHISANESQKIMFDYLVGNTNTEENFEVYIMNSADDTGNASLIESFNTNRSGTFKYEIPSTYADQIIYIGIKFTSAEGVYNSLAIDNFIFKYASTPYFTVAPNLDNPDTDFEYGQYSFKAKTGEYDYNYVRITSDGLTGDIAVSTNAPFECSADGENFASQISVPNTTEEVVLRFAPTEGGDFLEQIIFSSGEENAEITAYGNAIECSPIHTENFDGYEYSEHFDGIGTGRLDCWTVIDANNDGNTFSLFNPTYTYDPEHPNPADDWLISPALHISETTRHGISTYFFRTYDSYTELGSLEIYILSSYNDLEDASLLQRYDEVDANQFEYEFPNTYAGQDIYIGLRCTSPIETRGVDIVEFKFFDIIPEIFTYEDEITFNALVGDSDFFETNIGMANLTEDVTVTSTAPFLVSSDGVEYAETATLPNEYTSLYVKFSPETEYNSFHSQIVLTSSGATATIPVTGNAVDCSLSRNTNFNDNLNILSNGCWTVVDANNDGNSFIYEEWENRFTISNYIAPNDWLISPALIVDEQGTSDKVEFVFGSSSYEAEQRFELYILPSPSDIENAVKVVDETAFVPGSTFRYYIPSEYAGQEIHIGLKASSSDGEGEINITRFRFYKYTTGITPDENYITMDGYTNEYIHKTVNVVLEGLSEDVEITTHPPFEISIDGENYYENISTSHENRTLPLSIRYISETESEYRDSIMIQSGNVTSRIKLIGRAFSCDKYAPYTETFSNSVSVGCWTSIDADNNGVQFALQNNHYYLESYNFEYGSSNYDWAITPLLHLDANDQQRISFYYSLSNGSATITYYLLDDNTNPETAIQISEPTELEYTNNLYQYLSFDLPTEFAGTSKYFGINVTSTSIIELAIDNFSFTTINQSINTCSNFIRFTKTDPDDDPVQTCEITSDLLTEDIEISVGENFEVSTDNITFAHTTSMSSEGGTLYIKYISNEMNTPHSDTLTLSSGNTVSTIRLYGMTLNCSFSADYYMYYNNNDPNLNCWTIHSTPIYIADMGDIPMNFSNNQVSRINSAESVKAYDWLISPALNTDPVVDQKVKFLFETISGNEEADVLTLSCYALTSPTDTIVTTDEALTIRTEMINGLTYKVWQIPQQYKGQTIYFGIHTIFRPLGIDTLRIDNFSFTNINTPNNYPSELNLETSVGNFATTSFPVTNNSGNITATVTGEYFSIRSSENQDFSDTQVITQSNSYIFVKYTPTEAGRQSGTLSIDDGGTIYTITLNGAAIDCSDDEISELPFTEDFENGISRCWLQRDEDNDGRCWENSSSIIINGGHQRSANCALSRSFANGDDTNADNWIITKKINLPAEAAELSFYVAAQDENYADEHYGLYISTTGTDLADFNLVYEETINNLGGDRGQGAWKEKLVDLAEYAGQSIYIAWRHFGTESGAGFYLLLDDVSVYVFDQTNAENSQLSEMTVFPNPANQIINIANAQGCDIDIINTLGQVVMKINNASSNEVVDISSLAEGTYFVKANSQVVKINILK